MRFRDDFALAKTLNICKLPIRIDVQVVVNIFTSHSSLIDVSHLRSILITDCKSILQHFEEAHISHIHREENLALTFGKFVLHCHSHSFTLYHILSDIEGIVYPKLCIS